ncbi:hypothetical protein [Alistipes sp.]|uniref:hypothetical protein n=1 Tax=Alistipes sp. TaxID=1872444 RepID=UPI003AEF4FED
MKKILTILLCLSASITFTGCSENSERIEPGTENSNPANEYTYVKTITGYAGSTAAVTSATLKIYRKGSDFYATVGKSKNYAICSKNSTYNSSYTGRDPKKLYRYCAKPLSITYYFNL